MLVFVTLTDSLNNVVNSSEFTYHTDGLAPEISIVELLGPLELNKKSIKIEATVTDGTGISEVELYYRFSENDTWSILQMSISEDDPNQYSVSAILISAKGNMTYYVRAFDHVGLSARSDEFSVEYTVSDDDSIALTVAGIAGGIVLIAGIVYLARAGKLKLPKRKENL